jgi:D-alanyl-D-alanine carboxypeptidase
VASLPSTETRFVNGLLGSWSRSYATSSSRSLPVTSFPVRHPSLGRNAGRGYSLGVGPDGPIAGPLRDITRYSPSFGWASGHGVSTVGDIARLYRSLLRGRLLAPALLREALTGVPTGRPGRLYGLGLDLHASPRGTLVGHDGQVPGFDVRARFSPDGRGRGRPRT